MSTPIVSLASTKGGVGKTTLAFVLATSFAGRITVPTQYRVTCIDCDPNRALDGLIRKSGMTDVASFPADAENLLPTLREAQAASGLVIVDLEGSANQAMLYAAGKSNLVLIPAQPSALDVQEARKTAAVVMQAADLVQRDIPIRVVLTRTPVLRQRVHEHSRSQFARAALPLLQVELVQRTAYQAMTYTGQPPALSEPNGGAAQNVEAIVDAVAELVGLPVPERAAA
jgi:chromosome partitioning protein